MVNPKNETPLYGVIGFLLIIIVNISLWMNIILDLEIEGFIYYYFPFIWTGFILFVDSLVYKFRGGSLLKDNFRDLIGLFIISLLFWFTFQIISDSIQIWNYIRVYEFSFWRYFTMSSIVFSFVLPSIFEVTDLIRTLTSFDFKTKKFKISRLLAYSLIILGIGLFLLPIVKPEFNFPLIWVSLFLIFDPINYLNGNPSIIRSISKSDWEIPISLLVSGVIVGFFWEFWNFWSYPKWSTSIPFFDFYRLFNIGVLGYSLYFFFSWELFAMYHFVRNIGKEYLSKISNYIKRLINKN